MDIFKEIKSIKQIKEKIQLAIIEKGVEVSEDTSLEDMVAKIKEIKVSRRKESKNG